MEQIIDVVLISIVVGSVFIVVLAIILFLYQLVLNMVGGAFNQNPEDSDED